MVKGNAETVTLGHVGQAVFEQQRKQVCDTEFNNNDHTKRRVRLLEILHDAKELIHFRRENGDDHVIETVPKGRFPEIIGGNTINAMLNALRVMSAVKADVKAVLLAGELGENPLGHAVATLNESEHIEVVPVETPLKNRPSRHVVGPRHSTMMFGEPHLTPEEMSPIIAEHESDLNDCSGVFLPFYFPELKTKQYLFPTSIAIRGKNLRKMLKEGNWSLKKAIESMKNGDWVNILPKSRYGTIPKNVCLSLNDEELTQIKGPNLQRMTGEKLLRACRRLADGRATESKFDMVLHLGRRVGGTMAYFAGSGREYLIETTGDVLDFQDKIAEKYGGDMAHTLWNDEKLTAGRGDAKASWIIGLFNARPDPENFTEEELMELVLGGDLSAMLIHHSKDSNLLYFDEQRGANIEGLVRDVKEFLKQAKKNGWIKITNGAHVQDVGIREWLSTLPPLR